MKAVVSSIVALAIAIAPLTAVAGTSGKAHHKPIAAKVVKHKKIDKTAKAEKVDKGSATAKAVVRVKHRKKPALKTIAHHAQGVELGGAGHREPKIERGVAVVPASFTTKTAHAKMPAPTRRASELPSLPSPNVAKAGKHGAEKGARKPAPRKPDADDGGGKLVRDEELAELVARIRGLSATGEEQAEGKPEGKGKVRAKPCLKEPVEIVRGPEVDRFALTRCDGAIAPLAIEHLSVLVRPGSVPRPTAPAAELAKHGGPEVAPGIRRVDARLVERLQALVDHFAKQGTTPKLSVISGYRPMSVGSMHASGRAIDFRLEGVKNEEVVSFCRTLEDTGCGYYPNSSFVHIDVRDSGAGHVSWIDASGPGESPRYVSTWPPAPAAPRHASQVRVDPFEGDSPLDKETVAEPVDEHPAEVSP